MVGNTVNLGDGEILELCDSSVNDEVTEITEKNKEFYEELKAKYSIQLEAVNQDKTEQGVDSQSHGISI